MNIHNFIKHTYMNQYPPPPQVYQHYIMQLLMSEGLSASQNPQDARKKIRVY